ncbi:hypothetical protein [Rahnella sikkimica]|uniref:hypothetical protein n=1 Tax=Rahnella sikkimica TaxID=1805933 RepID=UPI00186593FD|nr:hypothetical protein [Rahnella sikkimica]
MTLEQPLVAKKTHPVISGVNTHFFMLELILCCQAELLNQSDLYHPAQKINKASCSSVAAIPLSVMTI